jgi:hypothetical protein
MCAARGKNWNGSDPKCAFLADGTFTADNWACASMMWLREHAHFTNRNEDDCSLSVTRICPPDFGAGFAVCSYYKSRGCTPVAMFMSDDTCRPMSLSDMPPPSSST